MKTNKLAYYFVLAIPVINVIASNTTEYFSEGAINTGIIRAVIFSLFSAYFILTSYPNNLPSRIIIFYLLFYAMLVLLSSDILYSANLYLKFFLSLIMFPVGFYYINDYQRFKTLLVVLLIALCLHIVNIFISNIFNLGSSDYLDESFYFGSGRVNITKSIMMLVLMAPVTFLLNKKARWYLIVIYITGFVISMIGIKRSVLLSGISSLVIYALLEEGKSNLIRALIGFGLGLLILLTVYPKALSIFLSRYESRGERVAMTEKSMESEARYSEVQKVWDTWVNGSVKHKMIGTDLFNDRQFFNVERMLHTDYMIVLNGSGIIGFLLWFYLFWVLIKGKNKYFKYLKNIEFFRELNALFYMYMASQLIMSISGTVYNVELRSTFFLVWGAIIGTMKTAVMKMTYGLNESSSIPLNNTGN